MKRSDRLEFLLSPRQRMRLRTLRAKIENELNSEKRSQARINKLRAQLPWELRDWRWVLVMQDYGQA